MKLASLLLIVSLSFAHAATAQDNPQPSPEAETSAEQNADGSQVVAPAEEATTPLPRRWLLLCCGLPGDDEHRERLTEACRQIIAASEPVLGAPPEQVRVLAGDEEMQEVLSSHASDVGITTGESVSEALGELAEKVGQDDACWIVLLGHAHYYDGSSQFNVRDADFDQDDFAEWAKPLSCGELVFWITTPVSGFWVQPLSGDGRVVIAATEADLEFTGTEMPYALGDLLSGSGEQQSLDDVDQDGNLSLLDLYLAANLEVHGRFVAIERLQTEHAQLEDNGDGRGSELQEDYLPDEEDAEEEGAEEDEDEADAEDADDDEVEPDDQDESDETAKRPATPPPPIITNRNLDGFRSRQIPIGPVQTEGDEG